MLGSYIWGVASIPNVGEFWGATPEGLIPLYTVSMLLGAVINFGVLAPLLYERGIIAIQAGLTVAETMLMSLVVFTGASQFMAVVMP